jgi:hypothetical protein
VTDQFFIRSRGRVEGPFSTDKLRELAARGRFARHFEVSSDGKNWSLASTFPDLFPVPTQRKIRSSAPAQGAFRPGNTVVEMTGAAEGDATYLVAAAPDELDLAQVETEWHYAQYDKSCGPVAFSELHRLASAGDLLRSDLVWTDGMPEWAPAATAAPSLFDPTAGSAGTSPRFATGTKTCPTAIASLTLGLLGMNLLLFVGSVAAIVLGHMAVREIDRSRGALTGRGLAIFGLVLGYVTVAVGVIAVAVVVILKVVLQGNAAGT